MGFRVYSFERTGKDRVVVRFAVKADLSLIRRYGIRVQDLPLACLALLERRNEHELAPIVIFTEDEMSRHAKNCVAARDAAAQKRKPHRRPPSENVGAAWRAPQLW